MMIYFVTEEIQLQDIPSVLDGMGYSVLRKDLQIKAQVFDRKTCDRIVQILEREGAECAITYNFVETVSQACLEADVPYISWVYDSPQQELYSRYAHYPCNYIFVFDKLQEKRLKASGIRKAYHMPLAVYGDKVERTLQQGEKYAGQYEAEIAFVGQLYRIEGLEKIMEQADAVIRAAMKETMAGCFLNWKRSTKLHGTMQDVCVQYFSAIDGQKVLTSYPYMSEQYYYEAAVLCRLLANRERIAILNDLSERHDVRFYTFDKDVKGLGRKVKVCHGARYDVEVSHVYRQSKINLNITLHCIETGIPQRVFDVMAAGGFLLSNYQEELEELFVPGEDLVIYHNMEELRYYVDYYLIHEEERQRIARNGQRKTLQYHDLHGRMCRVLEIVSNEEAKRTEKYLDIFCNNRAEMEMMEELALCRNSEIRLGREKLFCGIETLEDAKDKYFEAWEGLRQLTIASEEEQYIRLCCLIKGKEISCFYIVWHIYVKKEDRERMLLRLCQCMKKYSMTMATELVSYGLFLTPHASALLLKKAECLMELSMWKEALGVLRQIKEPQGEILNLIYTLEKTVNS